MATGSPVSFGSLTDTVLLGAKNDLTEFFGGEISDFRLWKSVISANDIANFARRVSTTAAADIRLRQVLVFPFVY